MDFNWKEELEGLSLAGVDNKDTLLSLESVPASQNINFLTSDTNYKLELALAMQD